MVLDIHILEDRFIMKKIISLMLILSVAASALVFSSCGDDKSDNKEQSKTTSKTSDVSSHSENSPKPAVEDVEVSIESSGTKITETVLSELNKKISENQGVPAFKSASESLNSDEISKDLKLSLITQNHGNTYYSLMAQNFRRAALNAGFEEPKNFETDGTISSINDSLTEAVKEKSDYVFLAGDINKSLISGYIETAQANGVEVFSAGSKGIDESDSYVDYSVPINYQFVGELMADWGIVKTSGKINAIAVNCTDSELSSTIAKGFKKEFEKYVSSSDGSITTINVSSSELGSILLTKIQDALKENQKINYIFVFDDSAIDSAVTASISGKGVKVVATGGSAEDIASAGEGKVEMLVAQSYEWTAYAMVDYALRVIGGKTLPREQDVPVRVLTKESVEKAASEGNVSISDFHEICFGSNFIDGYSSLWDE